MVLLGLMSRFQLWLLVLVGMGRLMRWLGWVPLRTGKLKVVAGVAADGADPLV